MTFTRQGRRAFVCLRVCQSFCACLSCPNCRFCVISSRESTADLRTKQMLNPDKQTMLNDVKKCGIPDFSQCMNGGHLPGSHTPVPVKLEVDDPTLMAAMSQESMAPVSATEFTHGLHENHMLTTLTNSLVGL